MILKICVIFTKLSLLFFFTFAFLNCEKFLLHELAHSRLFVLTFSEPSLINFRLDVFLKLLHEKQGIFLGLVTLLQIIPREHNLPNPLNPPKNFNQIFVNFVISGQFLSISCYKIQHLVVLVAALHIAQVVHYLFFMFCTMSVPLVVD